MASQRDAGHARANTPAAAQGPHLGAAVPCTHCNKFGHDLGTCPGPPTSHGDITGCPMCKTCEDHLLDDCPNLKSISAEELFDILVTKRKNLPPFRTMVNLVQLAVHVGRYASLAHTMPLTKLTVVRRYIPAAAWELPNFRLVRDPFLPDTFAELADMINRYWDQVAADFTYIHEELDDVTKIFFREDVKNSCIPFHLLPGGLAKARALNINYPRDSITSMPVPVMEIRQVGHQRVQGYINGQRNMLWARRDDLMAEVRAVDAELMRLGNLSTSLAPM